MVASRCGKRREALQLLPLDAQGKAQLPAGA
jgi:hypothetical protein